MDARNAGGRLGLGQALGVAFFLVLPAVASATSAPAIGQDSAAETTLFMARSHEAGGNWVAACKCYEYLLAADRNQTEIKRRFLYCLRQCHRKYRQGDPSYTGALLSPHSTLNDAREFYKDVVQKIQQFYLHGEQATPTRLFQEGIEELLLNLEDREFCDRFVRKGHTASDILEFRALLLERWGNIKINSLAEACAQVRAVAREAARRLDLNSKLIVAEFACGACNALDEYTFFLPQGSLLQRRQEKDSVRWTLLEEGTGFIQVARFDETTLEALDSVLEELKAGKMEALVLDLRNNAGGAVDVAVGVVERFLPAPQVIAATSGRINRIFQSHSVNVVEVPLFVLVDGTTASAAELVAGAFKAAGRAELIGQTTFGKSLVQKLVPVSQAPYGALRITWAQFHLPGTDDLSKHGGIVPTVTTPLETADRDPALEVAVERARMLATMMNMMR